MIKAFSLLYIKIKYQRETKFKTFILDGIK